MIRGRRYLAFTYDGIVLSHPEAVTLVMHPLNILGSAIEHWHIGGVKALVPPFLDGLLVEVFRLRRDNYMRDLRFIQRIEEIVALRIELRPSRLVRRPNAYVPCCNASPKVC